VSTILAGFAALFVYLSPHAVRDIRIKFLDEPTFDKYAFVYIIYELNRQQRDWHFEVDFDTFDESALTQKEKERCQGSPLCYAELLADGSSPNSGFIGITGQQLGTDSFWQNHQTVSTVSTFRWEAYAPPNTYDYLAYSIIKQSILIHLNGECRGLPSQAFEQSRSAYGDQFEFNPRRREIKAAILTAHLSLKNQELLANCFGVDYMNRCDRLLSLNWLHDARVQGNLEKAFGIKSSP
jgi:hypothetical protein